ncbi:MAG: hypothetical protein ISS79_03530 [Phycisphaerae bacterium]|nr:hypothetical protein [Phycisphaerae bacterium]
MKKASKIVTVGLCPSWDTVCRFDGIEWGEHKLVDSATCRPAGKALNISRALAWTGRKNVAAGLWGRDDYEQMKKAMRELRGLVTVKMTAVEGGTRRNVTLVDTAGDREMHLRFPCGLASAKALIKLGADLKAIVKKGDICVLAGLMPESKLFGRVVRIVRDCSGRGGRIVVDTYGEALRRIVDTQLAWMINPNVAELRELLGEDVADRPASLARASRRLLDKVEIVLISRGKKGAVVVTSEGAWQGRCVGRGRVQSTVGCGDYLLGGFLKGLIESSNAGSALKIALKVATAKAWGWTEEKTWAQAQRQIQIDVSVSKPI